MKKTVLIIDLYSKNSKVQNEQSLLFHFLLFPPETNLTILTYSACACTAVIATTPTISSALHPRERSLTGAAIP